MSVKKTGIPKLRVGYNKVFGYYIEVTNSYKSQVPDSYIRKQTLTNCERYITPELKEIESRILGAKDRSVSMEYAIFDGIRVTVAENLERIQRTAKAIAALDVITRLQMLLQTTVMSVPMLLYPALFISKTPVILLLRRCLRTLRLSRTTSISTAKGTG